MDTIPSGEVFVRVNVTREPEANEDSLGVEIERVKEEVYANFIGRDPTPETLNSLREEIGKGIRNLPGVKEVKVTTPLMGSRLNYVWEANVNLNTGELSSTKAEWVEGEPVVAPFWISRLLQSRSTE